MTDITRLTRVRIGVRAVLALGISASIAANVLHAQDNPIARVISAWPPGALFITVEVVSRVPVQSRALSWARVAAATVIAGIAAWVSYWHMVAVAVRYGESVDSAHLLPLSVDGLVVVASICLFELGPRLRGAAATPTGRRWQVPGRAAYRWAYRWGIAAARLIVLAGLWEWIGSRRANSPTPTGTPEPTVDPSLPTDTPPVEGIGTPDSDSTGTPDRSAATPTGRGLALVASTPDDDALLTRLRGEIRAGRLKADPGADAIRKHLGVGSDRARRLRDQLQAASTKEIGEDREAAHA